MQVVKGENTPCASFLNGDFAPFGATKALVCYFYGQSTCNFSFREQKGVAILAVMNYGRTFWSDSQSEKSRSDRHVQGADHEDRGEDECGPPLPCLAQDRTLSVE